jgi:branched-chain amino acid transport system permease protein
MSIDQAWQLAVSGVVAGSLYGLLATGFGLIVGVTSRFHLAFATTFVFAAYMATTFDDAGVPLYLGIVGGVLLSALLGVAMEALIYRQVAEASPKDSLLAIFVSSLGLTIIGENLIRLVWGSQARDLPTGFTVSRISLGGGAGITTLELAIVVCSWVVVVGLSLWLSTSRQGRAIRAVRSNEGMASAVGIHPERLFLAVFAIGSLVGGIAAILTTMRYAVVPEAGNLPTLKALVIVFLAGLGSGPLRFAVWGMAVGLIESLSNLWISASWNSVVVFGIVFLFIALTPLKDDARSWVARARNRGRVDAAASGGA